MSYHVHTVRASFSGDLEGHAPSWPSAERQRTRPQRVPPVGCVRRRLWACRQQTDTHTHRLARPVQRVHVDCRCL